jgi:hypothetical protein
MFTPPITTIADYNVINIKLYKQYGIDAPSFSVYKDPSDLSNNIPFGMSGNGIPSMMFDQVPINPLSINPGSLQEFVEMQVQGMSGLFMSGMQPGVQPDEIIENNIGPDGLAWEDANVIEDLTQ